MSTRTLGSLNAGDVSQTVTFNDQGLKVTGVVKYLWHRADRKGQPQTSVWLDVSGNEVKIQRSSFTEIDVEDA